MEGRGLSTGVTVDVLGHAARRLFEVFRLIHGLDEIKRFRNAVT